MGILYERLLMKVFKYLLLVVSVSAVFSLSKAYGAAKTSHYSDNILSPEEALRFRDEVLLHCQVPAKIKEELDRLFSDPAAHQFLVDNPKRVLIAGPAKGRLQRQAQTSAKVAAELERLQKRHHQAITFSEENAAALEDFFRRHDLQDLVPTANTTVLTTPTWDFVVRIPRYEWYDTYAEEEKHIPMRPSQYQNVSRVFYSKQINDFIEHENLNRIYPFKQYLYHIPGKEGDLCDENYLVVGEKIRSLPSVELNAARFASIVEEGVTSLYGELEVPEIYPLDEELVIQILQVITFAAMWDIKLKNLFLIEEAGELKALFLDTEKPGLGGGADANFYHTDRGEVLSNTRTGLEGLSNIFIPQEAKRALIQQANELHKRKFEAEQRRRAAVSTAGAVADDSSAPATVERK